MNERIKELLVQAWENAEGVVTDHRQDTRDILMEDMQGIFEEFAKLIIQESTRIVTLWSEEEPCSEGYDITPVAKLKERFGVE